MDNNQFEWVAFYEEFAGKLLDYKNDRKPLVEKVKKIYDETGIHLPTLEKDNKLVDIDPFTVFGLFNKSSMLIENRIKILTEIKKLFNVAAEAPTSFDSIPVLNNQNATFYNFLPDRGEKDIDELWELFVSALAYAKETTDEHRETFSHFFDAAIDKKGIGPGKITMGLYWIAPDSFLNLDNCNKDYIYTSGKVPADVVATLPPVKEKISAETYLEITGKIRDYLQSGRSSMKDYKDLSYHAWIDPKTGDGDNSGGSDQIGTGLADADVHERRYWIYSPGEGAKKWNAFYKRGVMGLGWEEIGDLRLYSSQDEMKEAMKETLGTSTSHNNEAHATWQFRKEMKVGDVVFAKKGMFTLLGRGVVTSDYIYDPESDPEYPNIRKVDWINNEERPHPGQAVTKTLTNITPYTDYVANLNALYDGETPPVVYPTYARKDFLKEVYMDAERYNTLVELLQTKKNIILQGAPGVGKTFAAKRLAYSMMGCKNQERVMMVQFHQSYTYEDFIEGYKPSADGFEIRKGAFYNFCKKAADDQGNDYFFIIDEINRGNLSKIFGELFMLIEKDKRGNDLQLLYSNEKFHVPMNVCIIGMLNTADRSLALLDYALRRRFAFFEMKPAFANAGFKAYRDRLNSQKFNHLIDCVVELNAAIADDDSLGEGFCVGHSYFCGLDAATDKKLSNIVEFEMIPLLKEYWFDEPDKVKAWAEKLRSAIQ